MKTLLSVAALLVCGSCASTEGSPKTGPLPPDVVMGAELSDWYVGSLNSFESRPLWTDEADDGYIERYRFTYFGILTTSLQIGIDRKANGKAFLYAEVRRRNSAIERKRFWLSQRDFSEFKKASDDSGLWGAHPEFWVFKNENDICLDGMEVLLERLDADGYRFSNANTSCTSPAGMNRLAEKMVELAHLKSRVRWFPWDYAIT